MRRSGARPCFLDPGYRRRLLGTGGDSRARRTVVALALFDPAIASGIARISLAGVAFLGFGMVVYLSTHGFDRAVLLIPTWFLLVVWAIAACLTVTGMVTNDIIGPALLTTLLARGVPWQWLYAIAGAMCGRDAECIAHCLRMARGRVESVLSRFHDTGTWAEGAPTPDAWFDSGSMPFAQLHYPFEHEDRFEQRFPADFICEGIDQTRGWFYTLMVLATSLFGKTAFKNVVVNGLVLAEDGRKMSKRLKNYPDPNFVLDTYGADALRCTWCEARVVVLPGAAGALPQAAAAAKRSNAR